MTKNELVAFEAEVANLYNDGKIPYPVHLSDGNEDALIKLSRNLLPRDWVFSTWRSHYHALLKGVPRQQVMEAVRRGDSISMCFPEHRFYASGLVGGMIPVALGVAMAIKRAQAGRERCWCFVGDMTAMTGGFHEAARYSHLNQLPITFVVEDNGISVYTPTFEVWGPSSREMLAREYLDNGLANVLMYRYQKETYPHYGTGRHVTF